MTIAVARPATRPNLPGEWHPVATIAAAGLPTLFARAAAAVLRVRGDAALSPALDLTASSGQRDEAGSSPTLDLETAA